MTDLLPTIPKRVQLHLPPWGFNTLRCIYYLGLWTPVVMHGPIRLMDVVISFWKQSHVLFLFITRFKSVPADCKSLTFTPSMPSMADLFWGVGGICKSAARLMVYYWYMVYYFQWSGYCVCDVIDGVAAVFIWFITHLALILSLQMASWVIVCFCVHAMAGHFHSCLFHGKHM